MNNKSLLYHFHPESGWLNDPNGLVYFDGYYHIFYQSAPHFEQPWHESMVWGHARTKDFLHFEHLPTALCADMPYDEGGAWSGTAAVRDGVLYLFYASVDANRRQTVSVAYSRDGINFEKYPGNPIISEYPPFVGEDFRDPAILCRGDENYLVMASADIEKGSGVLLLYKSKDFFDFEYVGVLREYEGAKYCECPSFVHSGDKYLLSVSVVEQDGSHYFEVLCGDFDGKAFSAAEVSHFQKGPDEYAGQIFTAPDGRNIMISWVSGWQYADESECIGCLSLPLSITTEGGIRAYPVKEVAHLLTDGVLRDGYVEERFVDGGREVYIRILK